MRILLLLSLFISAPLAMARDYQPYDPTPKKHDYGLDALEVVTSIGTIYSAKKPVTSEIKYLEENIDFSKSELQKLKAKDYAPVATDTAAEAEMRRAKYEMNLIEGRINLKSSIKSFTLRQARFRNLRMGLYGVGIVAASELINRLVTTDVRLLDPSNPVHPNTDSVTDAKVTTANQ